MSSMKSRRFETHQEKAGLPKKLLRFALLAVALGLSIELMLGICAFVQVFD